MGNAVESHQILLKASRWEEGGERETALSALRTGLIMKYLGSAA